MNEGAQPERRTRTRELIEKLIAERQEVWVLYCRVAGLEPYHSRGPNTEMMATFCQMMVDYLAAGHFEVYQRIADGKERRRDVKRLAEDLYPRIAQTTQHLVDFNDKYDCRKATHSDELSADLSRLGENLATRMELEDLLLAGLRP